MFERNLGFKTDVAKMITDKPE
jgi:uncharacterized protein YfeS